MCVSNGSICICDASLLLLFLMGFLLVLFGFFLVFLGSFLHLCSSFLHLCSTLSRLHEAKTRATRTLKQELHFYPLFPFCFPIPSLPKFNLVYMQKDLAFAFTFYLIFQPIMYVLLLLYPIGFHFNHHQRKKCQTNHAKPLCVGEGQWGRP